MCYHSTQVSGVESKEEKKIPASIAKRQVKYLNHNVEQNYRCIRKLFKVLKLFSE
ncbi:hypothetical protein EMIT019CA3_50190 [Bacillus pseudomycoides]